MRTDRKMSRTGIHDVKLTNNQKRSDVILYFFSETERPFCKGSTPKYVKMSRMRASEARVGNEGQVSL